MNTITKRLGPFPFAHRQASHPGHCRFIHGHSWFFEIEYEARRRDGSGFIVDYGGGYMKSLKAALEALFDHTLVLSLDDPLAVILDTEGTKTRKSLNTTDAFGAVTYLPDVSCEGVAYKVCSLATDLISPEDRKRGLRVVSVRVWEEEKNSATYRPQYGERKQSSSSRSTGNRRKGSSGGTG